MKVRDKVTGVQAIKVMLLRGVFMFMDGPDLMTGSVRGGPIPPEGVRWINRHKSKIIHTLRPQNAQVLEREMQGQLRDAELTLYETTLEVVREQFQKVSEQTRHKIALAAVLGGREILPWPKQ